MAVQRTRPTRIAEDIGEKLAWVIELRGGSAADRLDPLVRKHIESWYADIADDVAAIKRAQEKARRNVARGAKP